VKGIAMETLVKNLLEWSKMTSLIDQRLSELDEGSDMYARLVHAREQYCSLIAQAQ
jgi:hypothetical protein